MSNARNAGGAYGFVFAQQWSLEKIKARFPGAAAEANIAQAEFDATFGGAFQNVQRAWELFGTNWLAMKREIETDIQARANLDQLSIEDGREFIKLVRKRAKGDIPSPTLETLLAFHPAYISQPEQEFVAQYTVRFVTNNPPQAKELKLHITVPKSWASETPERAFILRRFVSQYGSGREIMMLGIKDVPKEVGVLKSKSDSEKFVAGLLSEGAMRDALPDGATLKGWGSIKIESWPGFFRRYSAKQERLDLALFSEAVEYTVCVKGKLVTVSCQVGDRVSEAEQVKKRFDRYERLFKLIANSLVVDSLWE